MGTSSTAQIQPNQIPSGVIGLSLADLANQGQAETQTRLAGQQQFTDGFLANALAQQRAGIQANAEGDVRNQTFQRAEAMAQEMIAQRELAMRAAEQAARVQFESDQGNQNRTFAAQQTELDRQLAVAEATARREAQIRDAAGQPDWFTQQRFQTDENIRQARAAAAIEEQTYQRRRGDALSDERPQLSDFGIEAVNPHRGAAILGSRPGSAVFGPLGFEHTLNDIRPLVEQYGADTAGLLNELRRRYRGRTAEASAALWELGWEP